MSEILIYNLDSQKDAKLKMLCRKMNIGTRSIDKSKYGCTLGYLLGLSQDGSMRESKDFDEEMLYIAGLQGGMLHLFLDQLRRNKLTIPLKAVQTETNIGFTSYELYRELCAEREAFRKGAPYHQSE
ncbi:MAG: DUF3783 domain-containing protein [Ruminococcus sp.]|uniref:DUF3783 domain-containing protein n=1 Tax=Ruminococcus sp. TaxID=41978 RepID=UPI002872DE18|nr:DUF3783 domain-containing protein [Ruminococcus sp.]MBQ3284394.1 DUF3783 domain-containing protein [Ruminococcus sp.]